MYNAQLKQYINHKQKKFILLTNGKEVAIDSLGKYEYEALKEWGVVVMEFYKEV